MSRYKLNKRKWDNTDTNLLFGVEIEDKFGNLTLDDFGLYPEDSFLQSPSCPCGCGGTATLLLDTEQDVIDFCYDMVEANECDYCVMFALMRNDICIYAIKYDGEITLLKSKGKYGSYRTIGELFYKLELHCFGLIVPDEDGYRIVED